MRVPSEPAAATAATREMSAANCAFQTPLHESVSTGRIPRNFQPPVARGSTPRKRMSQHRGELRPQHGRFQIPALRRSPAKQQLWGAPLEGDAGVYYVMGPSGAHDGHAAGGLIMAAMADLAPTFASKGVCNFSQVPAHGYVLLEPITPER